MDNFDDYNERENSPVTPRKAVDLSISKELNDMGLDLLDSNNTSTPEVKSDTKKKEESRNRDLNSVKLEEEVVAIDDFEMLPNNDKIEEIDIPATTLDDLDSYFTESEKRPSTFFVRSRSSILPSSSHRRASRSSHRKTKKGTTTINTKPEPPSSRNAQPTNQSKIHPLNSDPFDQNPYNNDKVKEQTKPIVNLDDNEQRNEVPDSRDTAPHDDFADYDYDEPPADYDFDEPPADYGCDEQPVSTQTVETVIKPTEVPTSSKNDTPRPLNSEAKEQSAENFAKSDLLDFKIDQVEDAEGKEENDHHSSPKSAPNDTTEPAKSSDVHKNGSETEKEADAMEADIPKIPENSKHDTNSPSGKEVVKEQDSIQDASDDPVTGGLQEEKMTEMPETEPVVEKNAAIKKSSPSLPNHSNSSSSVQDLNVKQNAKKYVAKPKPLKRMLPDGKVISSEHSLLSSMPMKLPYKKRRLNKKTKGKGKSQTPESGETGGSGSSEGSSESGKNDADEDIELKPKVPWKDS
ncbi:unnamed protein product [Ambrosiozyma monospora]|uniref:Unnamed protein product n=1 Tax=Ambrosiozyma monospora TaxID=43982 RepID=A0ACB5T7T1_AMBMO|nr:unnamed protein product [Ambrosiozyma monospora]